MRTQNPSHAVRKNNGSILYKNACIVGLFTSAVSWPCCRQELWRQSPSSEAALGAGQGDLPPLLLLAIEVSVGAAHSTHPHEQH